jgi:hypothetical protein
MRTGCRRECGDPVGQPLDALVASNALPVTRELLGSPGRDDHPATASATSPGCYRGRFSRGQPANARQRRAVFAALKSSKYALDVAEADDRLMKAMYKYSGRLTIL